MEPDRHAPQIEILAQAVHQVPDVAFRKMIELIAEQRDRRGAALHLSCVSDLDAAARWSGWRVAFEHRSKPAIELAGRYPGVPFFDHRQNGFHELVKAALLKCRDSNQRDAADFGKHIFEIALNL